MAQNAITDDRIVGFALAVFGAAVVYISAGYDVGGLTKMGPGFMPLVLGVLMSVVGVLIAIANTEKVDVRLFNLRATVAIIVGFALWASMIEPFGLVAATTALVTAAFLAEPPFRWRTIVLSVIAINALGYLLFIKLLKLPIDAFGEL